MSNEEDKARKEIEEYSQRCEYQHIKPSEADKDYLKLREYFLKTIFASKEITNFPTKGDNKQISIRNSQWPEADYEFAQNIKEKYPKLWNKYGTGGKGPDKTSFTGGDAFSNWTKYRSGDRSESVLNWVKRREAFFSRHRGNKNIGGMISWLKWGGYGDAGKKHCHDIIREEIKKIKDRND